jgi:hypothetical protein
MEISTLEDCSLKPIKFLNGAKRCWQVLHSLINVYTQYPEFMLRFHAGNISTLSMKKACARPLIFTAYFSNLFCRNFVK